MILLAQFGGEDRHHLATADQADIDFQETFAKHPFLPISTSGSNFNPRNTQRMYACPVGLSDRTEVVKSPAFFELEPKLNIKSRFNWAGKIENFLKSLPNG